jgi:DNA replication protein DnaC
MSMEANLLLENYLKTLRLPGFLHHYRQFGQDAAQANLSYDRYLLALAEQEIAQRETNRQTRLIQGARFPVEKELADFDFTWVPSLSKPQVLDLAQGGYIRQVEPFLMVGNPGLGKTHLATGLALAACRQGHRVRFYNTAALVNDLLEAEDSHRLPKLLNAALKQRLIVLDELGFIPFSATAAHLMFQFCSLLYQRVALIITTNLRFADWTQIFGNERLTAALLDRLTHKAHILEFSGAESYRFRERMQREAGTEARKG